MTVTKITIDGVEFGAPFDEKPLTYEFEARQLHEYVTRQFEKIPLMDGTRAAKMVQAKRDDHDAYEIYLLSPDGTAFWISESKEKISFFGMVTISQSLMAGYSLRASGHKINQLEMESWVHICAK